MKVCLRLLCKSICRHLNNFSVGSRCHFCLCVKACPLDFDTVIKKINLAKKGHLQIVVRNLNFDIGYDSIYLKVDVCFLCFPSCIQL